MALAIKIADKLTVDLDLGLFHDSYREKMEAPQHMPKAAEAIFFNGRAGRARFPDLEHDFAFHHPDRC